MGWKEWRQSRKEKKLATLTAELGGAETRTTSTDMAALFSLITPTDGWLIPAVGWYDTEQERLLTASAWSYTAITGNARAMGQLQPVVQRLEGRRWVAEENSGHPLWKWIDDPLGPDAELPFWPWSQLVEWIAINRYLWGNAYLSPVITGRRIYAVQPFLASNSMIATEDANGVPERWHYGGVELAKEQVINVQAVNPASYWRGLSPLKAALRALDLDYFAAERQRWQMRNKVSPGLIVGIETPLGLTPVQQAAMQAAMTAAYSAAEDTGKP